MMSDIYILAGKLHSGKTLSLLHWVQNRNDVYGILSPVMNGKRFFQDVSTKKIFLMESEADEKEVLEVGKYMFSKSAFLRAEKIILSALKQKAGWLIIDEIGPLELKGEGLDGVLKQVLSKNSQLKILLVIREHLLEDITAYFGISTYTLFNFPS